MNVRKMSNNEQEEIMNEIAKDHDCEPYAPCGMTAQQPSSMYDMDQIIDEYGSDQKLRDQAKTDPTIADDIAYDPNTGTVQNNQFSYFSKLHYMLADDTRTNSIYEKAKKLEVIDIPSYLSARNIMSTLEASQEASFSLWMTRVHYLIYTLECSLMCNSNRYGTLFNTVGHLERFILNRSSFIPVYRISDAKGYSQFPVETQFFIAGAITADIYQAALLKRLETDVSQDFINLSEADIYNLCNYMVPSLITLLFGIIPQEAEYYASCILVDRQYRARSKISNEIRDFAKTQNDNPEFKKIMADIYFYGYGGEGEDEYEGDAF